MLKFKWLTVLMIIATLSCNDLPAPEQVPTTPTELVGPTQAPPPVAKIPTEVDAPVPEVPTVAATAIATVAPPEEITVPKKDPASDIKSTCVMNYAGTGLCKFSNVGSATAALCGEVRLLSWCGKSPCASRAQLAAAAEVLGSAAKNKDPTVLEKLKVDKTVSTSGVICTGDVKPKSTVEISFLILDIEKNCIDPIVNVAELGGLDLDWTILCSFEFVASK
jgi:hypothetical protein